MFKLRSLKENIRAAVDLTVVLMVGIAFAGLMVIAYVIWTLNDQLGATGNAANSIANITSGFDNAVNFLLIAITIFILAIAIAALLMLRGKN
ncbi:MAG: hypothetical protein GF375_00525 [Candidatus Omnitrophica bacterium]|nr:hypothetical protein [Candidatus Omnitrophota bacterium]